tara:strand:+ start:9549 stop:9743 length:195 start_codon:yes stop_codon:yes gene_type:complete
MNLQKMFTVVENTDLKRWEFTPNKGVKETSYTVAFCECDNLTDAWIAIYKSISKKAKRQLTSTN